MRSGRSVSRRRVITGTLRNELGFSGLVVTDSLKMAAVTRGRTPSHTAVAAIRAGADVIQLFDSWVGALSPSLYRERVAPWSARILDAVDVPTIHFGTGTATLLEEMAAAGGDVIGLDWRIPLDTGWARVPGRAVRNPKAATTAVARSRFSWVTVP